MRKSANASSRKGHSRSATERESESPKMETARKVTVDPQRIWNLRVDNWSCRKDHNKLARHGETRKGGNGSSPRGRSGSARNVEIRKAKSQHRANKRIQPTAKSAARSSLCFLRRLMRDVSVFTRHRKEAF